MITKKKTVLAVICLALAGILLMSACDGGGGGEETTQPDTTSAELTVPDSAPDETTADKPVVTLPPPPDPDTLRILSEKERGESLTGSEGDENAEYLTERARLLREKYGITLESSVCEDIVEVVRAVISAGTESYDLLLTDRDGGATLMSLALLEDLSGAGIDIEPGAAGVNSTLTEDLSYLGANYLIVGDLLVSDIRASSALLYRSNDPMVLSAVFDGSFTAEYFISLLRESESADAQTPTLAIDGELGALPFFYALGGELFAVNDRGVPTSAVSASGSFSTAYGKALSLSSLAVKSTDTPASFSLTSLESAPQKGELLLPLPKADAGAKYISPIDTDKLSFLAAPSGVSDGSRLSGLYTRLCELSAPLREAELDRRAEGENARAALDLIIRGARIDRASLFKWGDLEIFVGEGLGAGTEAAALLGDATLKKRNETVSTAAEIIAGRLRDR